MDRITIIQSLLLSNYWYLCPEDQKDTWYWLGVCLSLSTSIGLNDNNQHLKLAPPVRRLWRRIWWVCVLRDRVLAITTRKQLRIREEDISVPLVTIDDCETGPIGTNIAARLGSTLLCDPTTRTALARLFIEKVRLSLYAARVMVQTYTMTSHAVVTSDTVMLYSPRRDLHALSEAVKIHHDLEQWQCSLHSDCVFSPNLSENIADTRVLYVQRAALRIFSLVVSGTLYIPYLRTKIDSPSLDPFLEITVRPYLARMGSEAAGMADILLQHDLVRYLPPLSITYFLPASVRLIAELKHSSHESRGSLEYQLRQCNRILLQLRETWHIADSACAIVEGLISKSGAMRVSDSTAAVFLEQDPPIHQRQPSNLDEQAVMTDIVSTTEELFSHQNGSAGNMVESFPFSTNVFDDVLWSELEPWFWSPTGNPQWMDFEVPGYDTSAFGNSHY